MSTFVFQFKIMKVTYLGHGGFHLELANLHLVVDPFISGNPLAPPIDIDGLKADYILLTHGHIDHILDTERIAKNNSAKIVSCYEIANHYIAKGIKAIQMNHGGTLRLGNVHIKMVNAVHTSSYDDGSYAGNPAGFVIYTDDVCVYFSGDTALTMDMKLIPMTCPPLTVAVLCIGDHFTMGYKDAALAAKFVEASKVIGCHYDTFDAIKIDKNAVKDYFTEKQIELHLPQAGESLEF